MAAYVVYSLYTARARIAIQITLSNKETYKKICEQQSSLPVFLRYWWLDAVCAHWDVAIAKKGAHVAGVWPYAIEKKAGVSLLRNPKLTPYLGPHILMPADIKESNADAFEYETVAELLAQLPAAKVWNLSMQPGFKQAGVMKGQGLKAHVQQTFLIDLSTGEAAVFANMKESLRRNIRSGEKELLVTNEPSAITELYQFQKHTLNSKGAQQAYSLRDMEQLFKACTEQHSGAIWIAKAGDKIQAIIWNVWDAERSYYFMGAQNPAEDSSKAKSLLLWHAIKEAIKRGNKIFDMEGSMDAGVERFFRGFGGKRELYMVLTKNDSLIWKLKTTLRK